MAAALTLIALAMGYKVFLRASKEPKGGVRLLGIIVGVFVMAGSVLGMVCYTMKRCSYSGSGCMLKKSQPVVPAPQADK